MTTLRRRRLARKDKAVKRRGRGELEKKRFCALGDLRGPEDLGDPLAADALEVVAVVGDVLDLQHVELEAELLEIRLRRILEHA